MASHRDLKLGGTPKKVGVGKMFTQKLLSKFIAKSLQVTS